MGDVYKAFDPDLKRHVALKVLASELSRDADFVRRFTLEAGLTENGSAIAGTSQADGHESKNGTVVGMDYRPNVRHVEFQKLGSGETLPDFLTTPSALERTDDEGVRLGDNGVIRSRRKNLLNADFTFEVLVKFERDDKIAYIGLGPGVSDRSYNGLTDSVYLRFHAPWHGAGQLDVENWRYGRTPIRGKIDYVGVHRIQISKRGKVVTFLIDPDNDGPSDDDMNLVIPDIT